MKFGQETWLCLSIYSRIFDLDARIAADTELHLLVVVHYFQFDNFRFLVLGWRFGTPEILSLA